VVVSFVNLELIWHISYSSTFEGREYLSLYILVAFNIGYKKVIYFRNTECPKMSAHNLNIFTDKINRPRIVQCSPPGFLCRAVTNFDSAIQHTHTAFFWSDAILKATTERIIAVAETDACARLCSLGGTSIVFKTWTVPLPCAENRTSNVYTHSRTFCISENSVSHMLSKSLSKPLHSSCICLLKKEQIMFLIRSSSFSEYGKTVL
jgi:hypothetical protein